MQVKIRQHVVGDTQGLLEAAVRVDPRTAPAGLGKRIMSQIRARMISQEAQTQGGDGHVKEPLGFLGVKQIRGFTVFSQFYPLAKRVVLVGDFNEWKTEDNPMTRRENGMWIACLVLRPGWYKYRLIVDDNWLPDPYNDQVARNPYGECDSVVEVRESITASEPGTSLRKIG